MRAAFSEIRPRLIRLLIVLVCAVALSTGFSAAASAADRPKLPWHSCSPRRSLHYGIYRVDPDLFSGSHGRLCIVSYNGHDLQVLTSLPPHAGNVVAYPAIRIGSYYGARDPRSRLPVRLIHLGPLTLHVVAPAVGRGTFIEDLDSWFYNGRSTARHGVGEMIIIMRRSPDEAGRPTGVIERVEGRYWYVAAWNSCLSHRVCWRKVRFVAAVNFTRAAIRLRMFVEAARRSGLPGRFLGNIAFGCEIWSGGRGVRVSVTENGLKPAKRHR